MIFSKIEIRSLIEVSNVNFVFFENRNSRFNRSSNCINSKFYFELTNLIFNISKITFMKKILSNLFESGDNTHIKQLLTFFISINVVK